VYTRGFAPKLLCYEYSALRASGPLAAAALHYVIPLSEPAAVSSRGAICRDDAIPSALSYSRYILLADSNAILPRALVFRACPAVPGMAISKIRNDSTSVYGSRCYVPHVML